MTEAPENLSGRDPEALGRAGVAVEVWALMAGRYDRDASRLTPSLPYPSTLYSALGSRPKAAVWELIRDLGELVLYWESWEEEHGD